ncbi:MAG: GNAT family N-acetyltransferase [Spirochaetales bacterium]|nr:GNAT family N-acetyltransferase [Spirochaetales bacterium]
MISLETFSRSDIPVLLSWLEHTDSEFLLQFAGPGYSYPLDAGQLEETLAGDRYCLFTAKEVKDGRPVGHCQLMRINVQEKQASIGRVLVPEELRGKGIGREMLKALIALAAGELGLVRLDLRVFGFNFPAYECYRKLGFSEMGRTETFFPAINRSWTSISMEYKI